MQIFKHRKEKSSRKAPPLPTNLHEAIKNLMTFHTHVSTVCNFVSSQITAPYDRVEWSFLIGVMKRFGFHEKWTSLIHDCISTVTYSILCNGEKRGLVKPSRGLRQGDPLSPYLFLICGEGLSRLLMYAQRVGNLHGIKVADGAPTINHLLFADDCLVFGNATRIECENLQRILTTYEAASGQKVNYEKSAIAFSASTSMGERAYLGNLLGMKVVNCHEKYLGLPTMVGRKKGAVFRTVRERLKEKVNSWHGNLLSIAGKEVLIKSVLQAIPTYTMSVFQLPITLCRDLNALVAKFWWGKNGGRGIHWKKWKFLCKRKEEGGLGFRDFYLFNQAMLGKQAWRLVENPTSLVAKVLGARYYPYSNFIDADLGNYPSLTWRSILWGRELVKAGSLIRVGNGQNTKIFVDKWLPRPKHFKPWGPIAHCPFNYVAELIKPNGEWDYARLCNYFVKEDIDCILSIPLGRTRAADQLRWFFENNGKYSVRSGYRVAMDKARYGDREGESSDSQKSSSSWKRIWRLNLPIKIKLFIWKAILDIIPCNYNLFLRKVAPSPMCRICGKTEETTLHTLWDCNLSKKVWAKIGWNLPSVSPISFSGLFEFVSTSLPLDQVELFGYLVWLMWAERNNVTHGKITTTTVSSTIEKASGMLMEFKKANERHLKEKANRDENWSAPPPGTLKLNTDGGGAVADHTRGIGGIVRDDRGSLIGAFAKPMYELLSPLATELVALKVGLEFLWSMGHASVLVETDSLEAARLVNDPDDSWSENENIVADIKSMMLALNIKGVSFKPRECNGIAHRLASDGASKALHLCCNNLAPNWLMELVQLDSSPCNPS